MWGRVRNWFEVRIGLDEIIRSEKEYRVPRDARDLSTLGFVVLIAFIAQTLTGLTMLLNYIPHPDHAYGSVLYIMNDASFGWFFRMTHVVGSNVLFAALLVHVVYTFFRGSYARPRELTWLSGGLMFLVVALFIGTGSLLPWNQFGYWSATVLSSIPSAIPVIGDWIVTFVRGGEKITEVTLSRYFAFHAAFLPITAVILISVHIFLVIRKNLSSRSEKMRDRKSVPPSEFKRDVYPEGTPYYPDYLLRQTYMALAFFAFVFFAISFLPGFFLTEIAYMEADPAKTPEIIRPTWYFSAPFQFLKIVPDKFTGIITIAFVVGLAIVWPFLDTQGEEKRLWKRPALMGFFVAGVAIWIIFTVWGRFF